MYVFPFQLTPVEKLRATSSCALMRLARLFPIESNRLDCNS
jgi:hypothetical protein